MYGRRKSTEQVAELAVDFWCVAFSLSQEWKELLYSEKWEGTVWCKPIIATLSKFYVAHLKVRGKCELFRGQAVSFLGTEFLLSL